MHDADEDTSADALGLRGIPANSARETYFLVGSDNEVAVGLTRDDLISCGITSEQCGNRVSLDPAAQLWALAGSDSALDMARSRGHRILDPTQGDFWEGSIGGDSPHLRALALVKHRRVFRYAPRDGSPLHYEPGAAHGISAAGAAVFPRIDPAVIGLVELAGQRELLVARNARRSQYYSLIAGYVEAGESIEAAFVREVREETGHHVQSVRYITSQPWPLSGSLMLGMHALTSKRHPHCATDAELLETRWVSPEEVLQNSFPQPRPGSLAQVLMHSWATGTLEQLC